MALKREQLKGTLAAGAATAFAAAAAAQVFVVWAFAAESKRFPARNAGAEANMPGVHAPDTPAEPPLWVAAS